MGFIGDIFGDVLGGIGDFIGDVVGGIADFVGEAVSYISDNPFMLVSIGFGLAGLGSPLSMAFKGLSSAAGTAGGGLSSFLSNIGLQGVSEIVAGGADLLSSGFGAVGNFLGGGSAAIDGVSEIGSNSVASLGDGGGLLSAASDPNNWAAPSGAVVEGVTSSYTMDPSVSGGGGGFLSKVVDWIEGNPVSASLITGAVSGGLQGMQNEKLLEDKYNYEKELLGLRYDKDLESELALDDELRKRRSVYGVNGDGSGTPVDTAGLLSQVNNQVIPARGNVQDIPRYRQILPDSPNSNYQAMLDAQRARANGGQ